MEAYVHGISTRAVDDLVEAMGVEAGISKSEVSRICAGLDEVVGAFRTRTLGHIKFPYVYLGATHLNVRNATGQVVSMAVIVATGIAAEGSREILGLDVGDSEDETFWRGFLTSLNQPGVAGLRLVISDQHAVPVKALRRCFQGARHQRSRPRCPQSITSRSVCVCRVAPPYCVGVDHALRPRRAVLGV